MGQAVGVPDRAAARTWRSPSALQTHTITPKTPAPMLLRINIGEASEDCKWFAIAEV